MIKQQISSKERILSKVRRALQVPAPMRHVPTPAPTTEKYARGLPMAQQEARAWLPPVGETWDDQISLFAAQCIDLKAEFFLCVNQADLHSQLARMAAECGWTRLAAHPGRLTDAAVAALPLPTLWTHPGYDIAALELCDVALTECDALVSQTGSVLVTSKSAGGRTLSALAPHHVVLARRDQLVPDLTAAFTLLSETYGGDYPSLLSFITGPSRTGDIERILVLGAHGPKRLSIFCV